MKKYMRAMTDGFGIRLPMVATNDQNDPELLEINNWFRDQYQAFCRAVKAVDANPELQQSFTTYQSNVHDQCWQQAQRYLDRVIEIQKMPWEIRPAVNFQFGPECFEEKAQ
jgi:hypothetical protein